MIFKAALVLLGLTALSVANPAAHGEWRWELKTPRVTPNKNAMPIKQLIKESYTPKKYVSGTRAAASDCGRSKYYGQDRIVGGEEAEPNSWPWQVALFFDAGWFCGGTIIDSEWVLTAAHCADGGQGVEIIAGAHNIREEEPTQVTYYSTDFTVHEDWGSILLRNDIALIKVSPGIEFTPEIQPACLPPRDQPDLGVGELVTPIGWGLTSDSAFTISPTLNQVTDPTISNDDCASVYGGTITDDLVCIDATDGHGVCSGDSGGSLNYDIGDGTYCTEGVTSFVSSAGCQSGYPDGFTRLTHYLDWIESETGIVIP